MNPPTLQGKLDATQPFVPLNQCDPLPWEGPLDRLAYYRSRRRAESDIERLQVSRRAMWRGLRNV